MIDILAFGAHPDDVELGCGGILAKMAARDQSIVIVDLTLGQKGSSGTPEIRRQEGEAAAKVIGAERVFLDFDDCQVFDTYEGRLELVKVIRKYQPRLVIAPMWKGEQNHPDHLACGAMARHACRYARFKQILPDIPIHRPNGILHYIPYGYSGPLDFVIDVTDYMDIWKAMTSCHKSQMETMPYIDWKWRIASKFGILINKPYAQVLVKGNPIEIDNLMDVAQGTVEL